MVIGAIIAGFVILSLLLETFTSSPKSEEVVGAAIPAIPDEEHVS